jgi:phosphate transport system protein
MRLATIAMLEADIDLAEQVIDDDARIDLARTTCERDAQVLLALQAPVASDLRAVLAPFRIADRLERMGDLAVHVAEAVRRRYPRPVVPQVLRPRFIEMGRIAVNLAGAASLVIRRGDVAVAQTLQETDDEMDDLYRTLFSVVCYGEWDHGVTTAVDVSLLSRFYERFADHAVAVADQVVFAVTGEPAEQSISVDQSTGANQPTGASRPISANQPISADLRPTGRGTARAGNSAAPATRPTR